MGRCNIFHTTPETSRADMSLRGTKSVPIKDSSSLTRDFFAHKEQKCLAEFTQSSVMKKAETAGDLGE